MTLCVCLNTIVHHAVLLLTCDCCCFAAQILVLDGPPVALPPTAAGGNSGSGGSVSAGAMQAGPGGSGAGAAAGFDRSWPNLTDLPPAGSVHRRTRSSNTQLPPLDEHAVLSEPASLILPLPPTGAGVVLPPCGGVGLEASASASGGSSGFTSRRSSRADSEASSLSVGSVGDGAAGGGGLVCEPSSFGVCGDPAGAAFCLKETTCFSTQP